MSDHCNVVSVEIRNSKFTLKDLLQFLSPSDSFNSRLSVISHIDCNCFFAQVERNRLGLNIEDPLVCVQWHSLIAVSYSARSFGISRMDKLDDAKQKCPHLIPVHTAVFKKDNDYWEYMDNQPFPNAEDHKVSLDPYRRASSKILKLLKSLTKNVQKASVDEWYINLNDLVYIRLLELLPNFNTDSLGKDDPLPNIKPMKLEMKGLLYAYDSKVDKVTDYDDLFIVLGGIIMNEVREMVFEKLRYQTSCGVSNNMKMAKLLSDFKKPDAQTILLNYKIPDFLENFKLSDINSFGGKIGANLMRTIFGDQSVASIARQFDLLMIQKAVKDEKLALKIYRIINGQYKEQFNMERNITKTIGTSKNLHFGKNGESFDKLKQWLNIFSIDIKQRLMEYNNELDRLNMKPKIMTIRVRSKFGPSAVSKSSPLKFQMDKDMNKFFYAKGLELLKELEVSFEYPVINISLAVSNFEFISKEEQSIVHMFKNAEVLNSGGFTEADMKYVNNDKVKEPTKKGQLNEPNILNMIKSNPKDDDHDTEQTYFEDNLVNTEDKPEDVLDESWFSDGDDDGLVDQKSSDHNHSASALPLQVSNEPTDEAKSECLTDSSKSDIMDRYECLNDSIFCKACSSRVDDVAEHNDYHFALSLDQEINVDPSASVSVPLSFHKKGNVAMENKNKNKNKNKKRKGNDRQSRLPF